MLTDKQLQDIAHPMMNGNSFNNMSSTVQFGQRVIEAIREHVIITVKNDCLNGALCRWPECDCNRAVDARAIINPT
jgi:hypothetical protein